MATKMKGAKTASRSRTAARTAAPTVKRVKAKVRRRAQPELDDMKKTVHKVWLAGLGALSDLGEESGRLVDKLVDRGETLEEKGVSGFQAISQRVAEARDLATHTLRRIETMVDDRVASALDKVGVPTRDEIRGLSRRVSELTAKVEKLRPAARGAR